MRRLLFVWALALAQQQTPDDLTKEVREAQEEVCDQWRSNRPLWSNSWQSTSVAMRRAQIYESVPSMPKARGNPRSLSGEDVAGFADLCPEFNLEDMSSDPEVLVELLDSRCRVDMQARRSVQDADLELARQLARNGKIGKRSSGARKLFYLRDPFTTDVTGPLQGQGAESRADWKSGASDLVMESEIWWAVLFRQQAIFLTLSSVLKDHFLGKEHYSSDVEDDDMNESTIPGDMAFWSCGLLVVVLFWTCLRLTRRMLLPPPGADPPPDLCCPMSLELFTDPVVAADGETYERWWIEKWIHDKSAALDSRPRHGTGVLSPMGHGMLKHTRLVSNQAVRRLANQWREKHEKAQ